MSKAAITRHILHELFGVFAGIFAIFGIVLALGCFIAAANAGQLSLRLAGIAIMALGASNLCFFGHALLAPPVRKL